MAALIATFLPQCLAAVYAAIFMASAIISTGPGSTTEIVWYPHGTRTSSIGLEPAYIATPELLRVPAGTAARYYAFWGVVMGVKIVFGYFFLVKPLVDPILFVYRADFSCWSWRTDDCALVHHAHPSSCSARLVSPSP